jgi:6-phosphogluconolactonase
MGHVQGKAEGIYTYSLDPSNGRLTQTSVAAGVKNPSFLAVSRDQRFLYAVNEDKVGDGTTGGGVSAFAIDRATGGLTFLNDQPSHGGDPCHIAVDATGSYVVAVNHENGTVACYPVQSDGSLGPASDVVQHYGSSVDPRNQAGPHAHSVNFDPTNRFALVCDKGIDKVMVYRLDRSTGKLVPNDPPFAVERPGSAPRHLAFHPSRPYVFVINEIARTMTTFAFDERTGALRETQTLSTVPADWSGGGSTADVHVHPNGKFVYGSNRGHDSIAIFAFDESTEKLTALGHQSTLGKVPRNFNLTPDGSLLLAANQNSSTIAAFHVDAATGGLTPTGVVNDVPTPVCIVFAPQP